MFSSFAFDVSLHVCHEGRHLLVDEGEGLGREGAR